MSRFWRLVLLLLASFFVTQNALAHPHAWIDLRSRVLLNDEGQVYAFEFEWLFDDYYTVLVAEELGLGQEPTAAYLDQITKRNLTNLQDYDYFTAITYDGERQAVGEVTRYESDLHDGRLWMQFELPLTQPLDPKTGEVSFAVYDPTYWIEILHLEGEPIFFSGEGADQCFGDIIQPNPTLDQVTLAAAIDRDETGGDDLGELFAETVALRCS